MSRPVIQIGDEVREMDDTEYAQHLIDIAAYAAEIEAEQQRTATRAAALAKLQTLGLTTDEVNALVGT